MMIQVYHKLPGWCLQSALSSVFTLTGNSRHSQPRSQPCTANLWPGFGEICCFFSRSECLLHRFTNRPIRGQGSVKAANQKKGNVALPHTFGSSQPQSDLWCGEQREHWTQDRDNFISHHVSSPSHHPSTWRCQQNNKLPSKCWTLTPVKN